ncbi:MAG: DUF397 domain-containing protein [Actinomycetales bacterium]|nr:DUF397 domain-containing protein [Actinomycetales bacterium]
MDTDVPPRNTWFKSSASGATGCVEVNFTGGCVLVRDSKDPGGAVLVFDHHEWWAFILGTRRGEFDLREDRQ